MTSLRPQTMHQPTPSPTTSSSEHSTTPTSPHFSTQPTSHHSHRTHPYPYRTAEHLASTSTLASTSRSPSHRPPTPPLLRAPSHMSFSAYLGEWTPDQLGQFLSMHKCGHYVDVFQRNDIDGKVLLDLDMQSLKEMGVSKVGERVKLLSGIKDLRRRVTENGKVSIGGMGRSVVELRLNGTATPSPDWSSVQRGHERTLSQGGSQSSMGDRRGMVDRSLSTRRGGNTRPPPLDLVSSSRGHTPSSSYSHPAPPIDASAPPSASTQRAITPRPVQAQPINPGPQRPSISSQTSSSATITPSSLSRNNPSNLNLRAPPPRDTGRRSPSPVTDPTGFQDRPPPPAPAASSAAEYARQHAGTPTPPTGWQGRGPSPSLAERRAAPQPSVNSLKESAHRKNPSAGSTPLKQASPIKQKFANLVGRPAQPVHPFAATRDIRDSPPRERSVTEHHTGTLRTQTGGYTVGAGPLKSGSVPLPNPPRNNSTSSTSNGSNGAPMSLEDLRRQLVKFINSEDGTTRTVNVSSCSSGVEVLERVLKKFGKWNTGNVSTDGESDEEGERLEVDGWGVYTDDADVHGKC